MRVLIQVWTWCYQVKKVRVRVIHSRPDRPTPRVGIVDRHRWVLIYFISLKISSWLHSVNFDNQASSFVDCLLLLDILKYKHRFSYSVQFSFYSKSIHVLIQYQVFIENSLSDKWDRNPLLMRDIIRLRAPVPRTGLSVQIPVRGGQSSPDHGCSASTMSYLRLE